MKIGVPKEIKDHEFRVSLTPRGASALVEGGHEVVVERNAGEAIGFSDEAYRKAGARIVQNAQEAFSAALVLKVKEPQPSEYDFLFPGVILFGYLHLASCPDLARALMERGVIALGYETVTDASGRLPLLAPMSQIAGRLAIQEGSSGLTLPNGGKGILLSGATGVLPAKVMVLGAGMVGRNAARLAHAMGADVTLYDIDPNALAPHEEFGIKTCFASHGIIAEHLPEADLVVGATLVPGRNAPRLITRDMVKSMRPGSVIVDVSIDQGGSSETSRPTTHSVPFYIEEGVVHYCVTNMPALVSKTATLALTQATLPHIMKIAISGIDGALEENPGLKEGLQIRAGQIVHPAVLESLKKIGQNQSL